MSTNEQRKAAEEIRKYVCETLAPEARCSCRWQRPGVKDTGVLWEECWLVPTKWIAENARLIIVQRYRGGGLGVFVQLNSIYFSDDRPLMQALEEKEYELNEARRKAEGEKERAALAHLNRLAGSPVNLKA
jgi:hypothetical protein